VPLAGRAGGPRWQIVTRIDATSAREATALLQDEMAGGATGAELAFADSVHPLQGRIPCNEAAAIARAIGPLLPLNFTLRIDSGDPTVLAAFSSLAGRDGFSVNLARDPVAAMALGDSDTREAIAAPGAAGVAATADGRIWHAAGASDAQELGIVLATLVEMLSQRNDAARTGLTLVADSDQFATIAKFRAARLLTLRLAEVAGVGMATPALHAETAWRSMSRRESETNVLRAVSAAFGAAVGGADSITVLPFDALDGSSADGRRLARNTSIIMAEEAGLADVTDPGAGSGAIETLTERLAEAAWHEFQQIEAAGGIIAAIGDGRLLSAIAAVRDARLAAVIEGRTTMIGVNAFSEHDTPARIAAKAPAESGNRLRFTRLAEAFE